MTRISLHRTVDAPVDVVWEVVTDHERYGEIAPNLSAVEIVEGEGEGMVRWCVDTDGNEWTETCTRWVDGRAFAVAVDVENSAFHRRLFTRFEGEWRIENDADGVRITVAFDFDTRYGPLGSLIAKYFEYRTPSLVEAIFDGWEADIRSRLTADLDAETGENDPFDPGRNTNALYR